MLWHRIAYDWHVTVDEAQSRITSAQFTEIAAYLRKEPRGYHMDNWRAGMVAATIANVTPRKKGSRPLKPQDFYPVMSSGHPQLNEKQLKEIERRKRNGNSKRRNS